MAHKKIVIVDDDPSIVRILVMTFDRAGYQTVGAANGEEALLKVKEEEPDVMFIDVMMPGIDGYQVCQKIRTDSTITRQPYIIMLTARGMSTERRNAELYGADDFMTKPFSPSHLVNRVREVLD